jgi:hypothetical protein
MKNFLIEVLFICKSLQMFLSISFLYLKFNVSYINGDFKESSADGLDSLVKIKVLLSFFLLVREFLPLEMR